jgi:crotonobetainyl-CoA:carnitine CoA-transferase CaiB-like acyl-CoA transferase
MGNAHQNIVPYQSFRTSDGHIIITAGNDSQFASFCRVAGRPELASDERFRRNSSRVANRHLIVAIIEKLVAERPTAWWLAELEAAGVPAGPINSLAEVFTDPQVIAREMQISMPHHLRQDLPLVGSPLRLSETPVSYRRAPPVLGADTRDVLAELLGWSDGDIAALEAESALTETAG